MDALENVELSEQVPFWPEPDLPLAATMLLAALGQIEPPLASLVHSNQRSLF